MTIHVLNNIIIDFVVPDQLLFCAPPAADGGCKGHSGALDRQM